MSKHGHSKKHHERDPREEEILAIGSAGTGTAEAIPGVDERGVGRWRLARAGELATVQLDRDTLKALTHEHDFAWLDVTGPSQEEIELLASALDLHPLAVRSVLKFEQQPRLDDFGDFDLLIGYLPGPRHDDPLAEFHALMLERLLVTIHREEIPAVDRLLTRFSQSTWIDRPSRATFAICEGVAEELDRAVERMDTHLDHLEEDMFDEPKDEHLRDIQAMRKQLRAIRRTIIPLRDGFGPLGSGWGSAKGKDDERYLRSAYSDLSRAERRVEALRDRATAAMDTYLSRVSNRMNVMIERLTIVGTIFLPLTFWASFFGQNFDWLTSRIGDFWSFAVLGVLAYVVMFGFAVYYFTRKEWS